MRDEYIIRNAESGERRGKRTAENRIGRSSGKSRRRVLRITEREVWHMADIRFTAEMVLDLAGSSGVFPAEFPKETGKDLDDRMVSISGTGERFLNAAALLSENAYLGWQTGVRDAGPEPMVVFSGPGRQAEQEDLRWVFEDTAEIGGFRDGKPEDLRGDGRRLYLVCTDAEESGEGQSAAHSGSPASEKSNGSEMNRATFFWDFIKEVRSSGGIVRGIVQGGRNSRGVILISLRGEVSLRMRTMLSMAIPGADAVEICVDGAGLCRAEGLPGSVMRFCSAETLREICLEKEAEEEAAPLSEDTPIEKLELSVRTCNCLKRAGIRTLGELCSLRMEDLARIRNIGMRGVDEILAMQHRLADVCPGETGIPDDKDFRKEPDPLDVPKKQNRPARLEELVGLENVKTQVRKITAFARMRQDMAAWGKAPVPVVLNMEFAGNPGTAKTTVARILAGLFADAGVIRSGEVVEVGRADLVAKYEGQTAGKVREVFRRAEGKLLFIDEAYSLVEGCRAEFGDEAINTIVQEMENHRDDTVVIFAGYPDQMAEFFSRNPGLRSRVPFSVRFSDYTAAELVQIAGLEAKKRGFSISPEAEEKVRSVCAAAAGRSELGNGRFCRNLVESAVLEYAYRVYGGGTGMPERDFVLRAEDFAAAESLTVRKEKAPAGFRPVRRQQLSDAG